MWVSLDVWISAPSSRNSELDDLISGASEDGDGDSSRAAAGEDGADMMSWNRLFWLEGIFVGRRAGEQSRSLQVLVESNRSALYNENVRMIVSAGQLLSLRVLRHASPHEGSLTARRVKGRRLVKNCSIERQQYAIVRVSPHAPLITRILSIL